MSAPWMAISFPLCVYPMGDAHRQPHVVFPSMNSLVSPMGGPQCQPLGVMYCLLFSVNPWAIRIINPMWFSILELRPHWVDHNVGTCERKISVPIKSQIE